MKFYGASTKTSAGEQLLWRRIADELALAIERGEYKPGDALPTAVQLSARYGVHRHTVRQAFRFLASQGRVSVEQGRGTFVTAQRIPYRLGRRVSFRANLASSGLDSKGTILESSVTSAEFAPALELDPGSRVWCIRMLSEAGGMPLSTSTHFLSVDRFADFPRHLAEGHASISAAFAFYGIDRYQRLSTRLYARAATPDEARLLHLAENSPVLHSAGIDGTASGERLQAVETAFPSERIEILVEPE